VALSYSYSVIRGSQVAFRFSLSVPSRESLPESRDEPPGPDSEECVLIMEACRRLSETDARFHFSGFGREEWYMTVGYEMSAFLEEFPEAMRSLLAEGAFEIDLYPQGAECLLSFAPVLPDVRIECTSRTSWEPNPSTEVMKYEALVDMMKVLAGDFVEAIRLVDARFLEFDLFRKWSAGDFL
jgi:hypothetical protein